MRRLPIRVRVAAAFAVALAAVLAATSAFLYVRLGDDLAAALDRELQLRADDVGALVLRSPGALAARAGTGLIADDERFTQLLDARGAVVDGMPELGRAPLLSPAGLRRALAEPRFSDLPAGSGRDEPARLLAVPLTRDGQRLVLVVGATPENRREALADLRRALTIAGPLALLVATGAGYLLAGAGLRSVEAMRRRAAEISAERPGERLPVPPARDELGRLGETLNAMLDRLEGALERQRGFVADAGHELRTPLATLRAELDFALHPATSEQELRDAMRRASDETDRLAQLAGDLLLLASSDQGALPLRVEPVPVAELLESVRNRFLRRSADAGRPVEIEAPAGLVVRGDRLRLEQALANLLDNALRHGAGAVRMMARAAGDTTPGGVIPGGVELHVEDDGPGFPEAYLPQAFERFSRSDAGRAGTGSGLGLAIVEEIARAHGGRAHVRNREAGGADAWVAVPGLSPAAGR